MVTDHKPLVSLINDKCSNNTSPRLSRLISKMYVYNVEVKHIPGGKNGRADFLSRCPTSKNEENTGFIEDEVRVCLVDGVCFTEKIVSFQDWVVAVRDDQVLQKLIEYVCRGWPQESKVSDDLKPYSRIREELSWEGDLLFRGSLLVPPLCLRDTLMRLAHEGHAGATATKKRVRTFYWWPAMDTQIDIMVGRCSDCGKADKHLKTFNMPMTPVKFPDNPWQKLGLDIIGPMNNIGGTKRFAIVMVDYHSKWVYHKFVSEVVTRSVVGFMEQVFRIEGFPNVIVTDNGVQFESELMKRFLQDKGVKHYTTALYSPQGNGLVERMNKLIKETIQLARATGADVYSAVQDRLWTYHNTPHTTTGVSPFALLRGRCSYNSLSPGWVVEKTKGDSRIPRLDSVRERVRRSQERSKLYYDRRKGVKEIIFEIGDAVRVKKPLHVGAGASKFFPSTTVTAVSKHAVRVLDGRWWSKRDVAKTNSRWEEEDTRCETRRGTVEMAEIPEFGQESSDAGSVGSAWRDGGVERSEGDCLDGEEQGGIENSQIQANNPRASTSQESSLENTEVEAEIVNERPKRTLRKPKFLSDYVVE